MKKRILFCLLALLLILPLSSAMAATLDDVIIVGVAGQDVVLDTQSFVNAYTKDTTETVVSMSFPRRPDEDTVGVLKLDGTPLAGDQQITLEDVTTGDLVFTPADKFEGTIKLEYKITTDEPKTYSANVTITTPIAKDIEMSVILGESVTGNFAVANPVDGLTYSFVPDVLQVNPGKLTYDNNGTAFTYSTVAGQEAGTVEFPYSVKVGGTICSQGKVIVTVLPEPEPPFYADLAGHWVEYSATKLAEYGVLTGEMINPNHYFDPATAITRGEYVLWLSAMLELQPTNVSRVVYADSDEIPSWMIGYVNAASGEGGFVDGISTGNGKIIFGADRVLTKAEACKMLSDALKISAPNNVKPDFNDMKDVPDWAINPITNLYHYQIIKGDQNKNVTPLKTLNRAEAAEMIWQGYKSHNNITDPA